MNFSQRDSCSWSAVQSGCTGGWNHNSPPNIWRDTVTNMMDGFWFSTQTVGHCNASSETETEEAGAEQCTWRVAEVKNVVRSDCVNGQIVKAVVKRNSSCFNALPQPDNRTTDGWIECFFNSLLGNHTTDQPSIAGSALDKDDDVSKLRQAVLDLWLTGFNGSCPSVASNNTADPPGTPSPRGVETLQLYVDGPATNLTNRNSADAAALVANAIHAAFLPDLCAVYGGGACDEADEADPRIGRVLTAATVSLNTLHGQFADCNIVNGSYHCFARWECWCEHDWGGNNGQDRNPCLENGDGHDDCPCQAWGGCGGGKWGKPPANGALAVGKRTNAAVPATDAAGHEYSTPAGGECGSEENKRVRTQASFHHIMILSRSFSDRFLVFLELQRLCVQLEGCFCGGMAEGRCRVCERCSGRRCGQGSCRLQGAARVRRWAWAVLAGLRDHSTPGGGCRGARGARGGVCGRLRVSSCVNDFVRCEEKHCKIRCVSCNCPWSGSVGLQFRAPAGSRDGRAVPAARRRYHRLSDHS